MRARSFDRPAGFQPASQRLQFMGPARSKPGQSKPSQSKPSRSKQSPLRPSNLRKVAAGMVLIGGLAVPLSPTLGSSDPAAVGQSSFGSAKNGQGLAGPTLLAFGDRVKLLILESPDQTADGGSDAGVALFPRMDLSGDYAVDSDGTISVPLLGRLIVGGRPVEAAEAEIAAAFERLLQRTAHIQLTIVDRLPVYVLGAVKSPGSFKYLPGMMVLQAVALAGGVDQGPARSALVVEALQATERTRLAQSKLKSLNAKHARLIADRDGLPADTSSLRLVSYANDLEAEQFVIAETTALKLAREGRRLSTEIMKISVENASAEIQLLNDRIALFDEDLAARNVRLAVLQRVAKKGSVTQMTLMNAQHEILDISGRRAEIKAAILQVQQKAIESRLQLAQADYHHQLEVEFERANVDQQILDQQSALNALKLERQVLALSTGGTADEDLSGANPVYEVIRRNGDEQIVIAVSETTRLEPGDLLRLKLSGEPVTPEMGGSSFSKF